MQPVVKWVLMEFNPLDLCKRNRQAFDLSTSLKTLHESLKSWNCHESKVESSRNWSFLVAGLSLVFEATSLKRLSWQWTDEFYKKDSKAIYLKLQCSVENSTPANASAWNQQTDKRIDGRNSILSASCQALICDEITIHNGQQQKSRHQLVAKPIEHESKLL